MDEKFRGAFGVSEVYLEAFCNVLLQHDTERAYLISPDFIFTLSGLFQRPTCILYYPFSLTDCGTHVESRSSQERQGSCYHTTGRGRRLWEINISLVGNPISVIMA